MLHVNILSSVKMRKLFSLKRMLGLSALIVVTYYFYFTTILTNYLNSRETDYHEAFELTILGKKKDLERAHDVLDREKRYFELMQRKLDSKNATISTSTQWINSSTSNEALDFLKAKAGSKEDALFDICSFTDKMISSRVRMNTRMVQKERHRCNIAHGDNTWQILEFDSGHYTYLSAIPLVKHLVKKNFFLNSQILQSHFLQQCCSRMVVAIHREIGAIYRLNMPYLQTGSGPHAYRRVCFLRRWNQWTGHVRPPQPPRPLHHTRAHFLGWIHPSETHDFLSMMTNVLDMLRIVKRHSFDASVTAILYCKESSLALNRHSGLSIEGRLAIGIHKDCDVHSAKAARDLYARWKRPDIQLSLMTIVVSRNLNGAMISSLKRAILSMDYGNEGDVVTIVDHRANCAKTIIESTIRASQTGASAPVIYPFQFGAHFLLSAQRLKLHQVLGKTWRNDKAYESRKGLLADRREGERHAGWSTLNASGWGAMLASTDNTRLTTPQVADSSLRIQLQGALERERKHMAFALAAEAACEFYTVVAMLEIAGTHVSKVQTCGHLPSFVSREEKMVARRISSRCGLAVDIAILPAVEEVSSAASCDLMHIRRDDSLRMAFPRIRPTFVWYSRGFRHRLVKHFKVYCRIHLQ